MADMHRATAKVHLRIASPGKQIPESKCLVGLKSGTAFYIQSRTTWKSGRPTALTVSAEYVLALVHGTPTIITYRDSKRIVISSVVIFPPNVVKPVVAFA